MNVITEIQPSRRRLSSKKVASFEILINKTITLKKMCVLFPAARYFHFRQLRGRNIAGLVWGRSKGLSIIAVILTSMQGRSRLRIKYCIIRNLFLGTFQSCRNFVISAVILLFLCFVVGDINIVDAPLHGYCHPSRTALVYVWETPRGFIVQLLHGAIS